MTTMTELDNTTTTTNERRRRPQQDKDNTNNETTKKKTINQKNDDGEGYQAINDEDNKNKETQELQKQGARPMTTPTTTTAKPITRRQTTMKRQ